VRLNINEHSVSVGFYETPSEEALNRIKNDVGAALSGQWDVSITPDDKSPMIHLHKIDNYTTEFHRTHPSHEPPVIWKRIPVPTWRNRPFPRAVPRDYRVMLGLAAICGLSTFIGFLLGRVGIRGEFIAPFFALAYVSGGWFATQDVARKRGINRSWVLMVPLAGRARWGNGSDAKGVIFALYFFVGGALNSSQLSHTDRSSRYSKLRRNKHCG
jgi:hypothetical protein